MTMRVQPNQETSIVMMNNVYVVDQVKLQNFEKIAIHRLIRKLDWRILPYMFLIEVGSYINRISIGHASVMGMENDLKLTHDKIEWSISLFFLAFLIFAIPSNIFMRYIGPTGHLSLSMLAWGSLTIGMAFVKTARDLLAVQALLGMTQAGFFPSMIIYISLWYRKRDHTMRIAFIFGGAIIASGLGSILAYGFIYMDEIFGLQGWQWMFLLEGLPLIPLGVITYLFLSNIPNTVQWLDNCEKQLLTNLLRDDAGIANREDVRLAWRQAFYVFIDVRIYLYALISVGNLGVIKYINAYLPMLVANIDTWKVNAHLLAIPPYGLALICCLVASYSSSRRQEYAFHIAFCLSIALVGFTLMITFIDQSRVAAYVGKCIACCGSFSAYPLVLSWMTNNVSGHTKRSMAVGCILGIGQVGGVVMPFLYYDESNHRRNNFICVGTAAVSLILTIVLRISLMIENYRRDRLSQEQYDHEAAVKDPCDWHPHVRYIL